MLIMGCKGGSPALYFTHWTFRYLKKHLCNIHAMDDCFLKYLFADKRVYQIFLKLIIIISYKYNL
jgi:hypothetical protein